MSSDNSAARFVVQWEEHPSHLASRLGQLLEQQTLVDVTLMCNTHTLRVHRSVLAACSPYFENLLQNISQRQLVQHPLIVLKDMQFSVLKCMIEFMYCGETNVTEDDLGPLLQAARFFQVKGLNAMTKEALGLTQRNTKAKVNGEVSKPAKPAPKPVSTPLAPKTTTASSMGMISKQMPIKSFAVRESPGLRTMSTDPAELLLSLSADTGRHGKTGFQGQPAKVPVATAKKDKVMSDTEMALRKEAEASRRALETLQKQMSSESEDTEVKVLSQQPPPQQQLRQQTPQQPRQQAGQANLIMKSKLVPVSQQSKPVATTPAKKPETTTTTVTSGVTVEEADSGTVTYQISDTGSGTVMSQYMEVLKDAGLPTDVPILIDSGDGNYVHVNEEVLMNIVNGGGLSYQVTTEHLHEVRKPQEGEMLVADTGDPNQLQQQVVRYVDDNGDIVEGVLAVVQEGEEGTNVAVTPSGQVFQIQESSDGASYQLVEAPPTSSSEGLISGDLEPPAQQEVVEEAGTAKRTAGEASGEESAAKKMKVEGVD